LKTISGRQARPTIFIAARAMLRRDQFNACFLSLISS
jgi:hypothetical protein